MPVAIHCLRSTRGAAENIHKLGNLAPLLGGVAADDGVLDAMGDVLSQDLLLDAPQRGADGGDLCDDVDAVAILLDHAGEATTWPSNGSGA